MLLGKMHVYPVYLIMIERKLETLQHSTTSGQKLHLKTSSTVILNTEISVCVGWRLLREDPALGPSPDN